MTLSRGERTGDDGDGGDGGDVVHGACSDGVDNGDGDDDDGGNGDDVLKDSVKSNDEGKPSLR